MHETSPQVFLIARPSLDLDGMRNYLLDVGGESWLQRRLEEVEDRPNGGELIVEFAGRACYRSWEPGLNPNVTRVRADQREYFANILRSAHGSVLEHANYSFIIRNCSRVFTHELVRHRAGSAFSQGSLRASKCSRSSSSSRNSRCKRRRSSGLTRRACRSTSRRRSPPRCAGLRRSGSAQTSSGPPTHARCVT